MGWEQFVYESDSNSSVFIQYWMIDFSGTCPAGWISYSPDCYKNSSAVNVPQTAVTNLASVSLTGKATSGGNDTFIVQIGGTLYSLQNQDSVVNLAQGWQQAEFNVFGDCCSTAANFNSGASLVVRTSVDYGSVSAPSCYSGGFTGETNNLSFASATHCKSRDVPGGRVPRKHRRGRGVGVRFRNRGRRKNHREAGRHPRLQRRRQERHCLA